MQPAVEPTLGIARGHRAIILAGGKGVRLHPFTANFPKPLVPLGDTPIVEILIRRLIEFGIVDITLTLGHLAELLKAYFLTHKDLTRRLTLRYVDEVEPTGTAGSLANITELTQPFLVMNGDLLTDIDFNALVLAHKHSGAALTIATYTRNVKIDLGVLNVDDRGDVVGYIEKPEYAYLVSMGIYVYEPRVLKYIEPKKYLDFPDLVLRLLDAGERVNAFPWRGLWLDIGRPDDYARAQEIFSGNPNLFLSPTAKASK